MFKEHIVQIFVLKLVAKSILCSKKESDNYRGSRDADWFCLNIILNIDRLMNTVKIWKCIFLRLAVIARFSFFVI